MQRAEQQASRLLCGRLETRCGTKTRETAQMPKNEKSKESPGGLRASRAES